MSSSRTAVSRAREVLKIEAQSILSLVHKINGNFSRAVDLIFQCKGRVIITGIGKSGLIGRKIVATLTSTGTQALFLHPVEGIHGDLGIVTKKDILLAISNSGETRELLPIISSVRKIGAPIISFTGVLKSTLAQNSDIVIDVSVEKEACPFGLAPTSSSTAALAMGDALAIALIDKRKFREKDFYKFHPGGSLGARLRATVRDAMITGDRIPRVITGTPARQAIEVIDRMNVGFVLVTDKKNHLIGILTDGDVRRMVSRGSSFDGLTIDRVMTANPKTIDEKASLAETVEFMQKKEITSLAVVNEKKALKGYVHLHDIFGRGGSVNISLA
ncbi:MAG: KpsF/GutQ family sugar-phosphate isomerase [Smithella sp.]|jgi:arabinose-5-phosphate isomerase|nr:KpsF/GutQ family sugar-phosphate isomerase [Syntrophaceae bacterium]NMC92492.1 KpsF/GutQ family sugar-phosphate isomerase [Smithella sp.]MBP8665569.1 KpsF/GutQ family sugar-phosphate isomerase [Syntrophaceae bacterium]MBP9532584.1 KpsF/GutQ family sugar-phosphate isomerase [Syntrophaceae bacterium]MBP9649974.1 KpsF/GutQ family sugar-phosphate isomerase [Syntrophaceae bacterium]